MHTTEQCHAQVRDDDSAQSWLRNAVRAHRPAMAATAATAAPAQHPAHDQVVASSATRYRRPAHAVAPPATLRNGLRMTRATNACRLAAMASISRIREPSILWTPGGAP